MKNYEKYADEIREFDANSFCSDFIAPNILESDDCGCIDCDACHMRQTIWLLEDYKEPENYWSKVEVDTPILVRDNESQEWFKGYFAKYEGGKVYAWDCGCTSWAEGGVTVWNYAKLAESEEE